MLTDSPRLSVLPLYERWAQMTSATPPKARGSYESSAVDLADTTQHSPKSEKVAIAERPYSKNEKRRQNGYKIRANETTKGLQRAGDKLTRAQHGGKRHGARTCSRRDLFNRGGLQQAGVEHLVQIRSRISTRNTTGGGHTGLQHARGRIQTGNSFKLRVMATNLGRSPTTVLHYRLGGAVQGSTKLFKTALGQILSFYVLIEKSYPKKAYGI